MRRRRSPLTRELIAIIKRRLLNGEFQHDIAADYGLNQGRVSEILNGKRGSGIKPAAAV
jgi:hypothetical protein